MTTIPPPADPASIPSSPPAPFPLRDYQIRTINAARRAFKQGHKRICICMIMGAGKTRTTTEICSSAISRGGQVLWLALRTELIKQAADSLERSLGYRPGIIAPWAEPDPSQRMQVASVQTLISRNLRPPATLVVFDEAAHVKAETYEKVLADYPNAIILGLTATPERQDGRPLGDVFQALVTKVQPSELLLGGWLCPVVGRLPEGGGSKDQLACTPFVAWSKYAEGKKSVVFCSSIIAAEEYWSEFMNGGIPCGFVTSETPFKERVDTLARYASGNLKVICNVNVLTEGWDDPATEVIILARQFGHYSGFLQAAGRGMRPFPGKAHAVILDLCENLQRYGLPDEDRKYSLTGKHGVSRTGEAPLKMCPECFATLNAATRICPQCGFEFKGDREDEPVAGAEEVPLVEFQRKAEARQVDRDTADPHYLESYMGRLLATQRTKGYKDGWVAHKWKDRFGHWPRKIDHEGGARWIDAQKAGTGAPRPAAARAAQPTHSGAWQPPPPTPEQAAIEAEYQREERLGIQGIFGRPLTADDLKFPN
jgi:DNA repair protein RadD